MLAVDRRGTGEKEPRHKNTKETHCAAILLQRYAKIKQFAKIPININSIYMGTHVKPSDLKNIGKQYKLSAPKTEEVLKAMRGKPGGNYPKYGLTSEKSAKKFVRVFHATAQELGYGQDLKYGGRGADRAAQAITKNVIRPPVEIRPKETPAKNDKSNKPASPRAGGPLASNAPAHLISGVNPDSRTRLVQGINLPNQKKESESAGPRPPGNFGQINRASRPAASELSPEQRERQEKKFREEIGIDKQENDTGHDEDVRGLPISS